jgi:translation elongation factor EF-1beta
MPSPKSKRARKKQQYKIIKVPPRDLEVNLQELIEKDRASAVSPAKKPGKSQQRDREPIP